jgi:hypothetical protein
VPTSHVEEGRASFKFHPWPGETLKLNVRPTVAAPGKHITVHSAILRQVPGLRSSRTELDLDVLTSRSLVHTLTIPEGSMVEHATVDGVEQPAKLDGQKLRLGLEPGPHKISVHFQSASALKVVTASEKVDVGAQGVNFSTVIDVPDGRWILWTGGPKQGPALLFWGYLVLILLLAILLPKVPGCPIGTSSWLLLGLGLTQVPVFIAVFIGGWFFAVASRKQWTNLKRFRRNFLQLGLTGYSIGFVFAILGAVYAGLVSSPDMSIQGAGSYQNHLAWYSDRSDGSFPASWVVSVSPWFFRAFMLLWSLWLASASLKWLRWAWGELQEDGFWAQGLALAPVDRPTEPSAEVGVFEPNTDEDDPPREPLV